MARTSRSAFVFLLALAFLGTLPATAQTSCIFGAQPAATLLLPYFEVDLAHLDGPGTLMAVGNRSSEAALARVTVWSDWAIPVLGFDILLPPEAVQTMNLRDVLLRGNLPVTGEGGVAFEGCTSPLTNPVLDDEALAHLADQLTGRPDATDGLCSSSDRGPTSLAVGFITVDVVTRCTEMPLHPNEAGYFASDGTGLAGYENILYGDFSLIDPSQDLAQGGELVSLPAIDPQVFTDTFVRSFYSPYTLDSAADARAPLGSRWQTRYLNGGAFDGGTDLLLWVQPSFVIEPQDCSFNPTQFYFWGYTDRSEDGKVQAFQSYFPTAFTARAHVGGPEFPTMADAGLLEVEAIELVCGVCLPAPEPRQSWLFPTLSASGRFSVGLNAVRLNDFCDR